MRHLFIRVFGVMGLLLLLSLSLLASAHPTIDNRQSTIGNPPFLTVAAIHSPQLLIEELSDGVRMTWQGVVKRDADGMPLVGADEQWPLVEIGNVRVPAQLITLEAQAEQIQPQIESLTSQKWQGSLPQSKTAAWAMGRGGEGATSVSSPRSIAHSPHRGGGGEESLEGLPTSPIVLLREGRLRGTRLVVLAISPLFAQDGVIQAATSFSVTIRGVTSASGREGESRESPPRPLAPSPLAEGGLPNPLANRDNVFKIQVSQAGIQSLRGAALADAGLVLAALNPSLLHLWRAGSQVPLEEIGTNDGNLGPTDELRFYAPPPGDRWNGTDTYWLSIETTPGLRMASRSVAPASAPISPTAIEQKIWRANSLYSSLLPGPDDDHWYAAELQTQPNGTPATFTALLTPTLPLALAPGTTTITISGSAEREGPHRLLVQTGFESKTIEWSGWGNWTETLTFNNNVSSIQFTLEASTESYKVLLDSLDIARPVILHAAAQGMTFSGQSGTWRYQITNPPTLQLYDISAPLSPQILTLPTASPLQFEDGPEARSYLLTGPGTLHTPNVTAHNAVDLTTALNANALYIAPALFHEALAPLREWRQAQGHQTSIVGVQAIYDTWSYGQVSPDAIRNFLRHAAMNWELVPSAVTLVGDGTSDPLNYLGRNNTNFIPPYLATVDPWYGETACETCYGQLDYDNPLDDPLPDLNIGRLPVKSVDELSHLVNKIIAYDTQNGGLDWRSRAIFIADNYRDAEGNIEREGAGDFAAFADEAMAQQPENFQVKRLYYDPSPQNSEPWYESEPDEAHQKAVSLLDSGAGIAMWTGHSHYWQWEDNSLMGLYEPDSLTNDGRPFILLEMTCLTSAFHEPAYSGTTIDERFILHPTGGAIAVWGPTGRGVMHGHDALQTGFFQHLWQTPPQVASLGELTAAGYQHLFSNSPCCQSALRTFALLGDPLTKAQVVEAERLYLPLTSNQ